MFQECRKALASMAIAALLLCGLPGPALGQLEASRQPCRDVTCAGEVQLREMLEYYRSHARVRLGRERRVSNGVAWRLLIDMPTGLAIPRITRMPDRQA